jgi:Flp pilus assembly protein TadD
MRFGLVAAVLATLIPAPASDAGDKPKERAKEELKFGVSAAKRGYWLEALTRFEKADELVPNQSHVLNNVAVSLEASGRFEEALLAYETATAIAPSDRVLQRNFAQFKEFYTTYVAPPPKSEDKEGADEEKEDDETEGSTEDEE